MQDVIRLKLVLTEKDKIGTWFSEQQVRRNLGTVLRWIINKVQQSIELLNIIANHLEVDIRELLMISKSTVEFN